MRGVAQQCLRSLGTHVKSRPLHMEDLKWISPPASDMSQQATRPAAYPTSLYPEIEPYMTGTLDVGDGHTLYYEQCGNPDGVPAIFLHGGPGGGCDERSRRFFDPAVYRIVVFDQRGSGRSTPNAAHDLESSLVENTVAVDGIENRYG